MRKTQAIFRAVIRNGYYGPDQLWQSPYMCMALNNAYAAGCIPVEEYDRACGAITRYLRALTDRPCTVMRIALNWGAGWDHDICAWEQGAGQAFYWNWDKRPRKTNNK